MRTEKMVLVQLTPWAEAQPNIRTILLTGSRAEPSRTPDDLSDYDVEVFVRDTTPFINSGAWLAAFGPIMVRWPLSPGPTFSVDWMTQLVLFEDGVRLDFQIMALLPTTSRHLDSGYRVIVDKDDIAPQLPPPTYATYIITPPTAATFSDRSNAFWWDIVYVAKALHRRELNYARYMLDGTIRFDKLQPLLEWHIGLRHHWTVDTGIYGRWFQRYLDADTWAVYESTFAGADFDDNWRALFAMVELVRSLGTNLAEALGFPYPEETDKRVTAYMRRIEGLGRGEG
ncbi:MAG: aminoglycoside 6-adenylyltransferase [Anaerolineaceae bacterium]|nr:aminoglycoside 6-adenylyltransferase [Anaerolineaceae bacterium]